MNVPDFPVTELFGCQPGYPLNQNLCPPGQGYHNGIDYGCPSGTPIIVNGVTIGISGATGAVTGPHCHVGKWVNGGSVNPGVGNGFSFKSAVVTDVNQDATNGKYVALNGDGARWVYLHMSDNSKVKVGQVLQGGTTEMPLTQGQLDKLIKMGKQDEPRADELNNKDWMNDPGLAVDAIYNGYGKHYYEHRVMKGDIDNLLKDVGITPTQADYDTALGLAYTSPKDFAYWLQGKVKNAPKPDSTILKPGDYHVN